MMGSASTLLVVLGILAAVHSQQETLLEDPTTDYYIKLIRGLLVNTTHTLQDALLRIGEETAKETSFVDLQDSLRDMRESMESLEKSVNRISNSVDNGVDRTRLEVRMFRNHVSQDLADLRQLLEKRTKDMTHQMVEMLAVDCQDLYDLGRNATGVYYLPKHGRNVLCEMEGGDGGWLVVQRRARVADQIDFNRGWDDYKKGFGDVETEFWIGNDFLHVLTNQKSYELYIDFHDYEKGAYQVSYSTFRVGNEASNYAIHIGDFNGNTSDAFSYHHGRSFSTTDKDNDLFSTGNCAKEFTGGWWYDRCYDAHLNGVFPVVPNRQNASFLTWWAHENHNRVPLVLDKVTMRIKPRPV